MSVHSATTPISLAINQNPFRRMWHFVLLCDQEDGAEVCVPTGVQSRTADLPDRLIFKRRLWLPNGHVHDSLAIAASRRGHG